MVKAFNTIAAAVMVEAGLVKQAHELFISGNDAAAKSVVSKLAKKEFGWQQITDLGDISGARSQEALLHIWIRIWGVKGNPMFNLHVAS